jgi:hypothetical protein
MVAKFNVWALFPLRLKWCLFASMSKQVNQPYSNQGDIPSSFPSIAAISEQPRRLNRGVPHNRGEAIFDSAASNNSSKKLKGRRGREDRVVHSGLTIVGLSCLSEQSRLEPEFPRKS